MRGVIGVVGVIATLAVIGDRVMRQVGMPRARLPTGSDLGPAGALAPSNATSALPGDPALLNGVHRTLRHGFPKEIIGVSDGT